LDREVDAEQSMLVLDHDGHCPHEVDDRVQEIVKALIGSSFPALLNQAVKAHINLVHGVQATRTVDLGRFVNRATEYGGRVFSKSKMYFFGILTRTGCKCSFVSGSNSSQLRSCPGLKISLAHLRGCATSRRHIVASHPPCWSHIGVPCLAFASFPCKGPTAHGTSLENAGRRESHDHLAILGDRSSLKECTFGSGFVSKKKVPQMLGSEILAGRD
jgi:hypothetical protein